MDNPDQNPEQNPAVNFFKDPRNLATGLVFLAALAQPRRQGQSTIGAFGERAVGAAAFRGALDQGIRRTRMEDEDQAAQRLNETRKAEFEQQQLQNQAAGLGIQRDQLSQADRLAREQNANALQIRQTATPDTPADAAYKLAMAHYYDRMPKGTGSEFQLGLDPQMLQDMSKAQWEQEVKDAALAGRTPDPTRVTNSLMDFMGSIRAAQAAPGSHIVRTPDGGYAVETGPLNPPTPQNAGGNVPEPVVPQTPAMPVPGAGMGVNLQSDVPIAATPTPARPLGHGSRAPAPAGDMDVVQWMQDERNIRQAPSPKLEAFLRDPRLTKAQLVAIRSELVSRNARRKEGTAGYLK